MTEVYFACSIRGGGDTSHYLTILEGIKKAGGNILSEIFVHDAINYGGSPLPSDEIYERDTQMIRDCDVMIAEVTNPSLGVGYELAYAEGLKKPILCLFDKNSDNKLSAMVDGNEYNQVEEYADSEQILSIIKSFIHKQSRERNS